MGADILRSQALVWSVTQEVVSNKFVDHQDFIIDCTGTPRDFPRLSLLV